MKCIVIQNGHAWPFFCAFHWALTFSELARTRSEGGHYHFNSLRISAIGLTFGGMMHSMMSQIAVKMAILGHFFLHLNFEIFYDRIEPGRCNLGNHIVAWYHDAVYHEAEHCMKWPHSANVCIFWSRPSKMLSYSERPVHVAWNNCSKTLHILGIEATCPCWPL